MSAATRHAAGRRGVQGGFTLLELAIVLAVIGVIVGAVAIGQDLYRNASYQRIASTFVQGWQLAYDAHTDRTGIVPGDRAANPTGDVNEGGDALCDDELLNAFLAAGVAIPEGRAEGANDRYVYEDSNGIPQAVQVCFQTVEWSVPDGSVGDYVQRDRNVMVLRNLTPSLARYLDSSIDGKPDARFGRFRQVGPHDDTGADSREWTIDDRAALGGSPTAAEDEAQIAVVTAYYRMNR